MHKINCRSKKLNKFVLEPKGQKRSTHEKAMNAKELKGLHPLQLLIK